MQALLCYAYSIDIEGVPMTEFRSVQLKTVVTIDGKDYVIEETDYSESVTEAIKDEACDGTSQDIIEYVWMN